MALKLASISGSYSMEIRFRLLFWRRSSAGGGGSRVRVHAHFPSAAARGLQPEPTLASLIRVTTLITLSFISLRQAFIAVSGPSTGIALTGPPVC